VVMQMLHLLDRHRGSLVVMQMLHLLDTVDTEGI
jgi:hypothetical protein